MKDLEKNKIFASIIISILVVTLSSNIVDILYKPLKVVDVMFKQYSNVDEETKNVVSNVEEKLNIVSLLANASAKEGEKIFAKCTSCHNISKGSPNKIGPTLWNIVKKEKASVKGFTYSKAMMAQGGIWDYEDLFHYLHKPQSYVKGTRMSFVGIKDYKQIADLILYLRTYSDSIVELPK